MFKKLFITLFFLLTLSCFAQYSIKGTLNPGDKYSWILLYNINNGKQNYIGNAEVKDGKFEFTLSKSANPGIYKAFYEIKNQLYVEFIFNRENIDFRFDPNNPSESIQFLNSDENNIYQLYFKTISEKQKVLDSLQVAFFKPNDANQDLKLIKNYHKKRKELLLSQNEYEKRSEGKIAHHFIKASQQYNDIDPIKIPENYLTEIKKHFFDYIDFEDNVLINSTYITDKIIDYIFYLNQNGNMEILNQMQKESTNYALNKLENNNLFKKHIEEDILRRFAKEQNAEMVNFVINDHYNNLPESFQDPSLKHKVLSLVKSAIGNKAPDIFWEENGVSKNLYGMFGFDLYIVVFFSSGCPHCQIEMPLLYDFIKDYSSIKVIAIGLEDEKEPWEDMIKDLKGFTHILDMKKWESKRVEDYGFSSIPSFFVLDKEKNIIAKPDAVKDLKELFETK